MVIGACIEVHRKLGPGLLEAAYEECVASEFETRGIPFAQQVDIDLHYGDRRVKAFTADFIVADRIVLELKSVRKLMDIHVAQLRTYAKVADKPIGLLVNFNVLKLREGIKRIQNP